MYVCQQILLTPPDEGPRVKGQRIKLQDIVDGLYNPLKVNGSWISRKYNRLSIVELRAPAGDSTSHIYIYICAPSLYAKLIVEL